jgi:hypothetical protein
MSDDVEMTAAEKARWRKRGLWILSVVASVCLGGILLIRLLDGDTEVVALMLSGYFLGNIWGVREGVRMREEMQGDV